MTDKNDNKTIEVINKYNFENVEILISDNNSIDGTLDIIYKYKCEKCNYKCKYESQWTLHTNTVLHKTGIKKTRSDKQDPYKCEKCNKEFKYESKLNEHKNRKNPYNI